MADETRILAGGGRKRGQKKGSAGTAKGLAEMESEMARLSAAREEVPDELHTAHMYGLIAALGVAEGEERDHLKARLNASRDAFRILKKGGEGVGVGMTEKDVPTEVLKQMSRWSEAGVVPFDPRQL